jgi:hypothetical protein
MKIIRNGLKLQAFLVVPVALVLLFTLIYGPHHAYAQWPPFKFELEPSYTDGKITYRVDFRSQVEWPMTDIVMKIPPPEGTRFLEAGIQPATKVEFDGTEITVSSTNARSIRDAVFVVEVVDPTKTVFSTHAWIAWQGAQPGSYVTEDMSIDITKKPLDWQRPRPRLQLEATAVISDDVITYTFYPINDGKLRMWDLRINVPLPEETSFLAAEAPAPFVANFDGQEASFFIMELERQLEPSPLIFKVSTTENTVQPIVTHAWASWINVGKRVGQSIPAQEAFQTSDVIIEPQATQQVVSDVAGDVPFANYDLTAIALQDDGPALKVTFNTATDFEASVPAEPLVPAESSIPAEPSVPTEPSEPVEPSIPADPSEPAGEPLEFYFYIDGDCQLETGRERNGRGVEYRLKYKHENGRASLSFWNEVEQKWGGSQPSIKLDSMSGGNKVSMWIPYDTLELDQGFCWTGEAKNRTKEFSPNPPTERIPNSQDQRLVQYALN